MTFFEEIKKPFNLFTLLLAIIGIILSVFFYYKSEKTKEISYILYKPPSLIFDSKNSSSTIKVVEKDSAIISGNVYLLTGSLWNSGDYPISKEDVRLPVSITLSNYSRILDFNIINQKDSTIANFVLLKEKPNSLNIGWTYFDPGFGFKFQIMYVGNDISGFKINGKILGINEFTKVEIIEVENRFELGLSLVFSLVVLIALVYTSIIIKRKTNVYDKFYLFMIIVIALLLSFSVWLYFANQTTAPI